MAAAEVGIISVEETIVRHRREKKELQAKIQALKKNAPKSDKKKRKEAMEEIARMESELEKRQTAELVAANDAGKQSQEEENTNAVVNNVAAVEKESTQQQQRISKAQKRRDKKAKEARQREDDIRAAAEESNHGPKIIETNLLCAKLKDRSLAIHQVPSDGDCLYNAIRHQLQRQGLVPHSVKELREETANYIRANKETLIHYMTHPRTGDLLDDDEFLKYCDAVANTPAWGGEIELKALSSILKVPIEVLQAEGPPTIHGANEFQGQNLCITYHRHLYSLGEHYNSTIPLSEVPKEDDDGYDDNDDDNAN